MGPDGSLDTVAGAIARPSGVPCRSESKAGRVRVIISEFIGAALKTDALRRAESTLADHRTDRRRPQTFQ